MHTSCLFYDLYDLVLMSLYVYSIVSYELQHIWCHLSTHEVYYLLTFIGYLYSDSSTSCLIRALVPYHSHL